MRALVMMCGNDWSNAQAVGAMRTLRNGAQGGYGLAGARRPGSLGKIRS